MDHDTRLATLRAIAAGFDRHDLDPILEHFAEDAVFESPRGGHHDADSSKRPHPRSAVLEKRKVRARVVFSHARSGADR
jgi:hypothetical protein